MSLLNTPKDQDSLAVLIGKTVLATFLISGIITYAIKNNGNLTTVWMLMLISTGILFGVLALVLAIAYPSAEFRQWTLRKGAVDTQWLFFNQNPPGFDSEKPV